MMIGYVEVSGCHAKLALLETRVSAGGIQEGAKHTFKERTQFPY